MEKKLYHILCNTQISLILKGQFTRAKIENYVNSGGLHLHLFPNQLPTAKAMLTPYNLTPNEGMLPDVAQDIQTGFIKICEMENQDANN